ncbi:LysR family transcriptional regulator [Methylobacterium organophilum]|uniref:HTH-type transcriptional regulator GltC n=1 Tax=Methylobacterium organophilum TaxID=410 RepID=A0ABQ4TGE8_METOR|nr:LysR family transcriptional regulator [Methylobacterium organophilum]UMY17411.1 LysR family transcriptional regulator [Methylobacterium organophilum]GJE29200.1 HTH-type transcriptional regulator GltC [Methylobacterium organophilum]
MHFQWIALRYFRETVQARSIRKASETLNVAPSAVNRQIIKIEEQLGAPLFERSSRGLKLTAAGELFYRWVLTSQGGLDQTITEINDLRGARTGHVTVACEEGIAKDFLPAIVRAFRAKHRQVGFTLQVHDMQDVVARVAEGQADLGLAFSPMPDARVRRRSQASMAIGAVLHPAHPLAVRPEMKLSDLIGETLVLPDNGFSTRQIFNAQLGGDAELLFARRIETNSFETMTALIKAGIAIGVRSQMGIAGEIARGDVVFVPFERRSFPPETVTLLVKGTRILPAAGAHFVEAVDAALRALTEESRWAAPQADSLALRPSA